MKRIRPKDSVPLVGIREFITSPDYLGRGSSAWPAIVDECEQVVAGGYRGLVHEVGIGGGKSFKTCFLLLYQIYRMAYQEIILGNNPRLNPAYELDQDTLISAAVVSVNQTQAKKVVFEDGQAMVRDAPWFKEYLPWNPRITSSLRFSRQYEFFPGHSKPSSVLGLALLAVIVDEANSYIVTEGADYVRQMHDQIDGRILSRFGKAGFLGIISQRVTVDDFTAARIREIQGNEELRREFHTVSARSSWYYRTPEWCARQRWRAFNTTTATWGE